MKKYFMLILGAAVLALVLYMGLAGFKLGPTPSDTVSDQRSSEFLDLLVVHDEPRALPTIEFDVGGETVGFERWAGHYVVVNFWATWCAPCRREMPQFDALSAGFADQGLVVIALSVDRGRRDKPDAFLDELAIQNLVRGHSGDQTAARKLGLFGLPTTLIIDPDGRELARLQGEADWGSEEAFTAIRALKQQ